jgi:hypothetical protein
MKEQEEEKKFQPLDLGERKISRQIKQRLSHDRQISLKRDRRWGAIAEIGKEIKA